MAYRKDLLKVTYHYDDDSGMYEIGEIDFGIPGELDKYLKKFGESGKQEIIQVLNYLITEIGDRYAKIREEFGNAP